MRTVGIEYGDSEILVSIPGQVDVKGMGKAPAPVGSARAIIKALEKPIESASLFALATATLVGKPSAKAVIVVSDNTRPVPYRDENGIMVHILHALRDAGFAQGQITVMIGAGSHRNMESDEIEQMLGLWASGFGKVNVVNHEYDNPDQLTEIGITDRGTRAILNKQYVEADLKIVTGLVESHFMAGASGGRKGICPGIVGKETLTTFHGATLLSSSEAADLVIDGNPLNEESMAVAKMAGCDFLVNVTLDAAKNITGIFAGDLVAAHQAAVKCIREYVVVKLSKRYDVVVIPAGFVGLNHYQAAKAAIEASRAVRPGGQIVVVANNTDPDPIGGSGYKEALALLMELGREKFMETILAPDWNLIPEQWQVQMWCKVFDVIGSADNLTYCSMDIAEHAYDQLPGRAGIRFLSEQEQRLPGDDAVPTMVERAIKAAVERDPSDQPTVLLLKDGPYGIPEVAS